MKVSILTPIRNRLDFIDKIVHDFQSQTFSNLEWIIVDDSSTDILKSHLPNDSRIKYFHIPTKCNIGIARNLTAEKATGYLLIHMDSDDSYSPFYVQTRINFHQQSKKQITGVGSLVLYDVGTKLFTRYNMTAPYSSGCSLTYTKEFWKSHPFPDTSDSEDTKFINASLEDAMQDNAQEPCVVAITHPNNSLPRDPLYRTSQWSITTKPDWFHIK